MSSTISNNNIQATLESSNKVQYDNIYSNSKILSEKDKFLLRKQFIHIVPSYFNQSQKNNFPLLNNPNRKHQIEEYKKLQSEISSIKSKISELELSKKIKLSKIDSLRLLIRRVANEDCFLHSQSNNLINVNNVSRERRSTSNQTKNNNCYQSKLPNNNNNVLQNTNDCERCEGEEEGSEGRPYGAANNGNDDKDCFIEKCNFDFSFMQRCFSYCKRNLHGIENKDEHWNW